MIEGIFLAWYDSSGGAGIDAMFQAWEQAGVFTYMLPFLLIFALVFGILSKTKLFGADDNKNKAISGIIALAVSLMALRFGIVTTFFSDIFPRLGIALAGILVVLILLGLFGDANNRGLLNTLLWGAFAVAILIILQSTEMFGGIGNVLELIPSWIFYIVVLIVIMVIIVMPKKQNKPPIVSHLAKAFGGE